MDPVSAAGLSETHPALPALCTWLSGRGYNCDQQVVYGPSLRLALVTLSRLCFNSQLLQLASHWGRKRRVIVNGRTTHFRPPPFLSLGESHFAAHTRWDLSRSDIQAGQQTDISRV